MCAAAREPDNVGPSDERSEGGPSEHGPAMYPPGAERGPDRAPPLLSLETEFRPEPPWRASGQPAALSTAVATAELGRISPKKLIVAVPPAPPERLFGAKMWFLGAALIAGGVGGYIVGYVQRLTAPQQPTPVAEAEHAVPATEPVASPETARAPTSMPHLIVAAARVLRADEPAPLTISYWDAGSNVSVVIDGLAPGSTLGAGTPAAPNAWRLAGADLERAVIRPPRGFVGDMNLTLELRLADDTVVDRKSLQLTWSGESAPAPTASAEPSPRHLDASEITFLLKRGAELMAKGDVSAARMAFQPAAEAGEAAAAFALAETYDPLVLKKLGTIGVTSDAALARQWYEKAKALGSTVAPERLVALARSSDSSR
jgi:hypothetical protein